MANCFIVQPISERSEFVFAWYLEPALRDKFTLPKLGGQPNDSITADIFKHLQDDDLVVVLLGSPYRVPAEGNHWFWNPNVMLELGFRLGLHRHLICIREKRVQQDEPFLPFDLFDMPAIELLSVDEERNTEKRNTIIAQIRERAEPAAGPAPPTAERRRVWTYPAVAMAFGSGRGTIIEASDDAAVALCYPSGTDLVGLDAAKFVEYLTSEMVPSQREAFTEEQDRLFGIVFTGRKPLATVCMVFGKDAIKPGSKVTKAYLPIVTGFTANRGEPTILQVIYLDVTATAVVGEDGVVRCLLSTMIS